MRRDLYEPDHEAFREVVQQAPDDLIPWGLRSRPA
jgi:hypothetical protein